MIEKFTKRKIPKVMFVNCGHFAHRQFEDAARLNYVSAGRGRVEGVRPYFFSNQIRNLIVGDIVCVYRSGIGYVGIARAISKPMPVTKAFLNGQKVTKGMFSPSSDMFGDADDPGYEECLVEVKWLTPVYLGTQPKSGFCYGIYAQPHAVCSLDKQSYLKRELEKAFRIDFSIALNDK